MKYGTAPKDLSFFRRWFFPRIQRPPWLKDKKDDLNHLLRAQESVIQEGVVVLGSVIQVNTLLFKAGPNDHPGDILVSLDPKLEPANLRAIARGIYGLKGEKFSDKGRAQFSDYLANEMIRAYGWKVPLELSGGYHCFSTTTILRRQSLPSGMLTGPLFPMLVHPQTLFAMVLPHPYWSAAGWRAYTGKGRRQKDEG